MDFTTLATGIVAIVMFTVWWEIKGMGDGEKVYTIHDVLEKDGVTRKEQWAYRIGRQGSSMFPLQEGYPLMFQYPSGKFFSTSIIKDIRYEGDLIYVKTANTIYVLKLS